MIDWTKVPTFTFTCRDMDSPKEICQMVKSLKIDRYVYGITHEALVIKYGMSDDNRPLHGERIYRQVGKLFSWGRSRLLGPNDITFEAIDEKFKNLYGKYMDHKNITIQIWSFDNYPFETIHEDVEILKAEKELIDNYKKFNGVVPIGNEDEMDYVSKKTTIRKNIFEKFFED